MTPHHHPLGRDQGRIPEAPLRIAAASTMPPEVAALLAIQRTAGNAAVTRLVQRQSNDTRETSHTEAGSARAQASELNAGAAGEYGHPEATVETWETMLGAFDLADRLAAVAPERARDTAEAATTTDLIAAALVLDGELIAGEARGGRLLSEGEQESHAASLIVIYGVVHRRIAAASFDETGLPILEGVEWSPGSPLAGIVEDIAPFGNCDMWRSRLTRRAAGQPRSRQLDAGVSAEARQSRQHRGSGPGRHATATDPYAGFGPRSDSAQALARLLAANAADAALRLRFERYNARHRPAEPLVEMDRFTAGAYLERLFGYTDTIRFLLSLDWTADSGFNATAGSQNLQHSGNAAFQEGVRAALVDWNALTVEQRGALTSPENAILLADLHRHLRERFDEANAYVGNRWE